APNNVVEIMLDQHRGGPKDHEVPYRLRYTIVKVTLIENSVHPIFALCKPKANRAAVLVRHPIDHQPKPRPRWRSNPSHHPSSARPGRYNRSRINQLHVMKLPPSHLVRRHQPPNAARKKI